MKISYNGLWKLLIDNGMQKKDLIDKIGVSSTTIAKMGKGEKEYGQSDFDYRKPSFWEYLLDSDAFEKMGFIAFPMLTGNQEATLVKDIFSDDWESPVQKLSSTPVKWRYTGDVRILSDLGEITSKGERMAFISTGVGAKEGDKIEDASEAQGSTLYQIVRNTNFDSIEFEYDFVSEEPMEFFDSMYDDTFEVQIFDMDNNILSSTILTSVNKADWKSVDGIDFAGGDDTVYHTGWCNGTIDISAYRNKTIKIRFLVYDVGDSAYDSAALIDNIVCK